MPSRLFPDNRLSPPDSRAMCDRLIETSNGKIQRLPVAEALLRRWLLPPSQRWAFCRNGKTGTTTIMAWLFELEFGSKLTAPLSNDQMLNENSVAHFVVQADIFRSVLVQPGGLARLRQTCRIVTTRHPATRAYSAFRYICKSGAAGTQQFLTDRLRLNAETGFDWNTDPGTAAGFRKYLDYVEILHETNDLSPSAAHWRSQCRNLRPDVIAPTITGRLEDLPGMVAEISQTLGIDAPPPLEHHNTQGAAPADLLADPALRLRIAEVFRDDYARFGYDPAHIPQSA